jgi:hypothetical protein
MSAIEATTAGYKDMADNTLRITLEFEPRHAAAALALFGPRGTPVAVAALKIPTAAPAEKPKGGELAQWVAMRCQEAGFQRWAQDTFPQQWEAAPGDTPTAWAASVVRAVCGIESRAELDTDEAAAGRFHALIRGPFSRA